MSDANPVDVWHERLLAAVPLLFWAGIGVVVLNAFVVLAWTFSTAVSQLPHPLNGNGILHVVWVFLPGTATAVFSATTTIIELDLLVLLVRLLRMLGSDLIDRR